MLKRYTAAFILCLALLMMAMPAIAILKVLDPEVSAELRGIATEHLAAERNIDAVSITIDDVWLREFWNAKVDVYMIQATIDKGVATEQNVEICVRVDQKAVLSDAEFAPLEDEDEALTPDEP